MVTQGNENRVIPKGTIIRETVETTGNGNVIFRAGNGDIFTDTYVINNPLWFLPEEEITGTGETSKIQCEGYTVKKAREEIWNALAKKWLKDIESLTAKVEEPEAVRFAKWKDGNYAKDEGFYYELRPAEHKDTWNPDRGYKLSELYTKFKQEAK